MKGVMFQGTASDVGKSVLCTALCRIIHRKGYKVAPFKSQNMSNNSYVTVDGKEIGRAQGVQAEAAKTTATVYMNPILLKPRNDRDAEVVRFGKSYETLSGRNYREHFYEKGIETILYSLDQLCKNYEYLVVEGAGSPVEMNLNDREIVNMKVAELADLPVVLIADIDRGGVFASIVGTLELLPPEHRSRVIGVIINKFRGDITLFESGISWIEEKTGVKVLGVVPHIGGLTIEGEDSLSMTTQFQSSGEKKAIDLAVIQLPYVSNYTDIEPFRFEEDVSIRFVSDVHQFGQPDAVIIPGTKSTFHDLSFLKKQGLAEKIQQFTNNGGRVVGLCGGYQMLGSKLTDTEGTDTGDVGSTSEGLNIVPLETQFQARKTTVRSEGTLYGEGANEVGRIEGYEIHLGDTTWQKAKEKMTPFLVLNGENEGVSYNNGQVIGTYLHHLFHNDKWRSYWLNQIRESKGLTKQDVRYLQAEKEKSFERLADHVEQAIDVDYLIEKMESWSQSINEPVK
ncbi:cobyric acid synthase [Anaerobacillus sp. MEB173]|uniref:cobyric acid synthase n=1 Tax=Anaerobacillus sp. MEB173 TaxID=3383345 RepID=UPI003F8FA24F